MRMQHVRRLRIFPAWQAISQTAIFRQQRSNARSVAASSNASALLKAGILKNRYDICGICDLRGQEHPANSLARPGPGRVVLPSLHSRIVQLVERQTLNLHVGGSSPSPGATALSSRGLGRRPLTAVTRVRIPLGLRVESPGCFHPGDFFAEAASDMRLSAPRRENSANLTHCGASSSGKPRSQRA
jgi:hypothetical protein